MTDFYNDFRKRWNISPLNEKEIFSKFKIGILNSFKSNIGPIYNPILDSLFCKRAIIRYDESYSYEVSKIHDAISYSTNIPDLLFYSEIIMDLLGEVGDKFKHRDTVFSMKVIDAKKEIINEIKRLINILPLNIEMKESKNSVLFYPSGAKLLDEKIINDSLDWLSRYPKANEGFKSALEKYQKKIYKRNLLDDLRNSLEIFLKDYLENKKSLENQEKDLASYLKSKNISPEIISMFWILLDRYSKYQNEHIKHDDNVREQEIEFMIYLTGNFIRFLITLNQ